MLSKGGKKNRKKINFGKKRINALTFNLFIKREKQNKIYIKNHLLHQNIFKTIFMN